MVGRRSRSRSTVAVAVGVSVGDSVGLSVGSRSASRLGVSVGDSVGDWRRRGAVVSAAAGAAVRRRPRPSTRAALSRASAATRSPRAGRAAPLSHGGSGDVRRQPHEHQQQDEGRPGREQQAGAVGVGSSADRRRGARRWAVGRGDGEAHRRARRRRRTAAARGCRRAVSAGSVRTPASCRRRRPGTVRPRPPRRRRPPRPGCPRCSPGAVKASTLPADAPTRGRPRGSAGAGLRRAAPARAAGRAGPAAPDGSDGVGRARVGSEVVGSRVDAVPRSPTGTGVKVSLRALVTPCAPTVITPQVTWRQSTVVARCRRGRRPGRSRPGTTSGVDHEPAAAMVPPLAEPAVSEPGKATNFWKPWLSSASLSGT